MTRYTIYRKDYADGWIAVVDTENPVSALEIAAIVSEEGFAVKVTIREED